jgi:peptidoglycan/LPS O-acetylase OafA/YrhL
MEFLDGLRGAAALFVAAFHSYNQLNWRRDGGGLSHRVEVATRILGAGGYGVIAFIVLSGYCLMLPVARTPSGTLRGGWVAYLLRRCKRIMPPYYVALGFTLLLIWLIPALSVHPACFADPAVPVTTGALISHLFLLQNIHERWFLSIDPPMWSVAVEFQIYFLFPAILLPVYRRFGAIATVIVGFGMGGVISILTGGRFDYSHPDFIGLFCLGMLGAYITVGASAEATYLRRLPWLAIAIISLLAAMGLQAWNPSWAPKYGWAPHAIFGLATTCVLVTGGLKLTGGTLIRRLFESRWLVGLGSFSYSLYLVHMPLQGVLFLPLRHWVHSSDLVLLLNLAVNLPLVCLLAYGFYRLFERPFMRAPHLL